MHHLLPLLAVAGLAHAIPYLEQRWASASAPISGCAAATKTLFGPYTLRYPIAGFEQEDTFYAVEKPDGTVELAVHGSHDLPLGGSDGDAIVGDVGKAGLGAELVATEVIMGKTYTISLGGGKAIATPVCDAVTKKVARGAPGFPTNAPVWPRNKFGIKPGAAALPARAVQTGV